MATRKLQTEIDKVIKKVSEGVEAFEGIYEKLQQAPHGTQKEKMEADLKKEIKKLQRYRDQIKTWIASNDIKDKRALTENRKLIEHQMERFKAIEKELKTKAFSKEGLSAERKKDPLEQEKEDLLQWISDTVDTLSTGIDAFEAEAETLQGSAKKGKKDSGKNERLVQIEHAVERHKHHISRLEMVQRLLDNGNVSVESVKAIKDDVNFYVESHQDQDFEEDEGIYDDLNLDDAEIFGFNDEKDSDGSDDEDEDTKPVEDPKKRAKDADDIHTTSPSKAAPKAVPPTQPVKHEPPKTPLSAAKSAAKPVPKVSSAVPAKAQQIEPPVAVPVSATPIRYSVAAAAVSQPEGAKVSQQGGVLSSVALRKDQTPGVQAAPQAIPQPPTAPTQANAVATLPNQSATPVEPTALQASRTSVTATNTPDAKEEALNTPATSLNNQLPPSVADLVSSFEITKERAMKFKDDPSFLNSMLETSFQFTPDPQDGERPKYYAPSNPYPTANYYPQTPLAVFENPAIFEEFDIDTLFFIFYYQPGTYHQYLAARELKRQSWRFHKKFLTWFQRHEEPKAITEEFEQGTYLYFDFEDSWCQRKKSDFKFDYRWLDE